MGNHKEISFPLFLENLVITTKIAHLLWGGLLKLLQHFSAHPECPIQPELLGLPGCYLLPRFQSLWEVVPLTWSFSGCNSCPTPGRDAYRYKLWCHKLQSWDGSLESPWYPDPVHPSLKTGRIPALKNFLKWVISLLLGKILSQSQFPWFKSPC